MAQAKGILPRRDDRELLYKNPRTCGYFVAVKLDPAIDRARAEAWLEAVSGLVDELVERLPPEEGEEKGRKVAAVAIGLAPSFFVTGGAPRFDPPVEPPAAFAPSVPLPNATTPLANVPLVDADVLFYVASVFEARVNSFLSRLAEMRPDVQAIWLERGYQRLDETEPFGYKDGSATSGPRTAHGSYSSTATAASSTSRSGRTAEATWPTSRSCSGPSSSPRCRTRRRATR